jgi:hypothetical protein
MGTRKTAPFHMEKVIADVNCCVWILEGEELSGVPYLGEKIYVSI